MNSRYLQLCLVTNLKAQSFERYHPLIIKAIQGGITSVQLREKTANLDDFYFLAREFKRLLKPFNIPLIINDHVNIAKKIDADGIHIGQSDVHPQVARKIIGEGKIIGLSIESFEELERANQLSCIDYVAASAVFPSKTKPDCKTIWGIEGLRRFTALSRHPVMAIGGITHRNIDSIIESGAAGAAVIGAIHDAHDPEMAAKHLSQVTEKREYSCLKM